MKRTVSLSAIIVIVLLGACSLGGDLDDWRQKAWEANKPGVIYDVTIKFFIDGNEVKHLFINGNEIEVAYHNGNMIYRYEESYEEQLYGITYNGVFLQFEGKYLTFNK